MSRRRHADDEARRRLDALYATLPAVACKGKCTQACGAIALTLIEADRLREHAHRKVRHTADVVCTYLTPEGRCGVYAIRPLVCRLFGVVKNLSCPHGCVPERWVSSQEQREILRELDAIAGPLMYATSTAELIPLRAIAEVTQSLAPDLPAAEILRRENMTHAGRVLHGGRIRGVGHDPQGRRYINGDEEDL